MQAYLDHSFRNDAEGKVALNTADLTFQHTFAWGEHNELIWGLGYRFTDTRLAQANSPAITVLDHNIPLNLLSAFVQDEIRLIPDRLSFTLGTKVEVKNLNSLSIIWRSSLRKRDLQERS